jgi:glycosyltransferase involved in cell wall biosynthesis
MPWFVRTASLLVEKALGLITDVLLTQSRRDLALAEHHGIGPRERRARIGNGIDLARFRPREDYAGRPDPPVILCVARFEPVKNHALLFDAVELLWARGVRCQVRLVGSGPLEASLRTRAARLGGPVEFLGYRDDMPELLAEADVATLTSLKEGMPRAVLEAMAMARPVVATRVPGTEEAVRDGDTGFLVDVGDAAGLAAALERLLTDADLRARMGARGREVALAEFDERPIAVALGRLYRDRLRGLSLPAAFDRAPA